jgi:hypothetical protein
VCNLIYPTFSFSQMSTLFADVPCSVSGFVDVLCWCFGIGRLVTGMQLSERSEKHFMKPK